MGMELATVYLIKYYIYIMLSDDFIWRGIILCACITLCICIIFIVINPSIDDVVSGKQRYLHIIGMVISVCSFVLLLVLVNMVQKPKHKSFIVVARHMTGVPI